MDTNNGEPSEQRSLEALIAELTPALREDVRDYVLSLLVSGAQKKPQPFRQDWAGALKEFRDQYTSLDLQKKALAWRGD